MVQYISFKLILWVYNLSVTSIMLKSAIRLWDDWQDRMIRFFHEWFNTFFQGKTDHRPIYKPIGLGFSTRLSEQCLRHTAWFSAVWSQTWNTKHEIQYEEIFVQLRRPRKAVCCPVSTREVYTMYGHGRTTGQDGAYTLTTQWVILLQFNTHTHTEWAWKPPIHPHYTPVRAGSVMWLHGLRAVF